MLSKLAVRRLTKLADYMASLPKSVNKHFNMNTWFAHEGDDHHGLSPREIITKRELGMCGTTACALGWAATCPMFRRLGLTLRADDSVRLKGRGSDLTTISKKLFDMDYDDGFEYLFIYDDSYTPKEWARNCRKFIKNSELE